MGRGNVCVRGRYEGLFYVGDEQVSVYYNETLDETRFLKDVSYDEMTSDWKLDEEATSNQWDEVRFQFCENMQELYPSFTPCDKWLSRSRHAILENGLFYIAIEDNECSLAFELLEKDEESWMPSLQKKHFSSYLDGISFALFLRFESLGTYGGPWTSGRIDRPDAIAAIA